MKTKVIKITKKLNPKDSLDYDYVGDVYDKIDGAVEHKNIKIVSKQLILKSSPFKVAGKRKKSKRTKKTPSTEYNTNQPSGSSHKPSNSLLNRDLTTTDGDPSDDHTNTKVKRYLTYKPG